jgi:hypothetical protein
MTRNWKEGRKEGKLPFLFITPTHRRADKYHIFTGNQPEGSH